MGVVISRDNRSGCALVIFCAATYVLERARVCGSIYPGCKEWISSLLPAKEDNNVFIIVNYLELTVPVNKRSHEPLDGF